MDGAHLHLLLNHIPVLGTLFCLLLLAFALLRKSKEVLRAAMLGTVLVALVTVPAYLSGEAAEDAVKRLGSLDISTIMLDEHEDAAFPGAGGRRAGLRAGGTRRQPGRPDPSSRDPSPEQFVRHLQHLMTRGIVAEPGRGRARQR